MKAVIWMYSNKHDYKYGEYEYQDEKDIKKINEIAEKVKEERRIPTWVERVE